MINISFIFIITVVIIFSSLIKILYNQSLNKTRFRLFSLRYELFRLALDENSDLTFDKNYYKEMEDQINQTIRHCNKFSVVLFLFNISKNEKFRKKALEDNLIENKKADIKDEKALNLINEYDKIIEDYFMVLMMPTFILIIVLLSPFLILYILFLTISQTFNEKKKDLVKKKDLFKMFEYYILHPTKIDEL